MPNTTDDLRTVWGVRLRSLREQKCLSQRALAAIARLDQTWLSRIERGEKWPTVAQQVRLSAALGLTVRELFTFPDTVAGTAALAGLTSKPAA